MNYQPTYPSSPDYVIEAEFTDLPKKREPFFQSWSAPKSLSPERTMQQLEIDRFHAFITAVAIRNIAELSDLESLVTAKHPQNAYMCHALLEGYAEGAVRMVRGYR